MHLIVTAVLHWGSVFWGTLRETAPYLILGLFMAGMLHVLVPPRIIQWALGHRGWRGAVRGALIGLPLPLCSCGVVPTALTLRRQGASLSSSISFAIATPETSVDAMAVTAALLPTVFLGVRPLAALFLAITVGTLVELFARTAPEQLRLNILKFARSSDAAPPGEQTAEICRICGLATYGAEAHNHKVHSRIRAIFTYAFGVFFRDIATWLVLGLGVAALIQIIVPENALQSGLLAEYPNLEVLFAIIAGIPLYSCATATTPLAAVLLAKGLNPGAALALLLAGPATNIGNIFAFRRELGGRVTAIYYISLLGACWLLGVAFNFVWPLFQKSSSLTDVASGARLEWLAHVLPPWVEIGCSWVLLALVLNVWMRSLLHRSHDHDDHAGHAH